MWKQLSLFVLLLCVLGLTEANKCPKERVEEADDCARVLMMLGNRNTSIPETLEEIDQYCE